VQNQADIRNHTVIRPPRRQDMDALYALDCLCFRPGIAYSRSELRFFLNHPRSLSFIAETAPGSIAGFAIVETYPSGGKNLGHIITIDVDPVLRRHGIGLLLMDAMERRLRDAGAVAVRLEVAVDNAPAQNFYHRLGYRQTGRIRGFYMGTLDALTMEKELEPFS
jgi:ribosomal-protein-alanine N-acetyltransferase